MDTNALIAAVFTFVGILFTAFVNWRISKTAVTKDSQGEFRDDLLKRIDQQDKRLAEQDATIQKMSLTIETLKNERDHDRIEFQKSTVETQIMLTNSQREVSNWRDSYHMAQSQVLTLKQELERSRIDRESLVKERQIALNEIQQLHEDLVLIRSQHDQLRQEHDELKKKVTNG